MRGSTRDRYIDKVREREREREKERDRKGERERNRQPARKTTSTVPTISVPQSRLYTSSCMILRLFLLFRAIE